MGPRPQDCIASLKGTWTVTGWNWQGYRGIGSDDMVNAMPPSVLEFGSGVVELRDAGRERVPARVRATPRGLWMLIEAPGTRSHIHLRTDSLDRESIADDLTVTEDPITVEWRLHLTDVADRTMWIQVAHDERPNPDLPDRIGPWGYLAHEYEPPPEPGTGSITEAR